jgi:uncharacterized protein
MITRRRFFRWLGGAAFAGVNLATYAFAIEPGWRLRTVEYSFTPPRWTEGLKLRIALLADPHLVEPHMPLSRWQNIIARTNALEPDLILLMGDYVAGHRWRTGTVPVAAIAQASRSLKAPLGVFAICGNHDWWDDKTAQKQKAGPTLAQMALEDAGIPVLENKAVRIAQGGLPFWLTGTASIVAIIKGRGRFESRADLAGRSSTWRTSRTSSSTFRNGCR